MKVALPRLVSHSTPGSAGKPPQQIHDNRSMTCPLVSTCYSSAAIRWDRLGLLEVALAPFTPSRSENGTALAPGKVASYKNAVVSTIQQLTKLSTGKEHSAFQGGRTNVINLYKSS